MDCQEGVYEFQATFPGVYDARPIVHYHIKVRANINLFSKNVELTLFALLTPNFKS